MVSKGLKCDMWKPTQWGHAELFSPTVLTHTCSRRQQRQRIKVDGDEGAAQTCQIKMT